MRGTIARTCRAFVSSRYDFVRLSTNDDVVLAAIGTQITSIAPRNKNTWANASLTRRFIREEEARNHQTESRNAHNVCTEHPALAPAANLLANHLLATFSPALVLKFSAVTSSQIALAITAESAFKNPRAAAFNSADLIIIELSGLMKLSSVRHHLLYKQV